MDGQLPKDFGIEYTGYMVIKKKLPPPKKEEKDESRFGMGRKKNEPLIKNILKEIERGHFMERACLLHDISVDSWIRWRRCENLKEDMFDNNGLELSYDDRRCWECQSCMLQKRCDAAREKFISVHHEKVAGATIKGEDVWTASAWLLERTQPDRYGNRIKQELTHTLNAGNANAQKLVAAIIGAATKSE